MLLFKGTKNGIIKKLLIVFPIDCLLHYLIILAY